MLTQKGKDLLSVGALVAMLAVAGYVAMVRINVSQRPIDPQLNPSPLGYTFSLILFVLPCLIFGIWIVRSAWTAEQRRATAISLGLLIPIGFVLDLFFGRAFLTFPNAGATIGLYVPGYDLKSGWSGLWGPGWEPVLPIEEFAFYALGFAAMLLTYIWGDQILFHHHKVDDNQRTPRVFSGWTATLLFWLVFGAGLFGLALLVRGTVPPQGDRAFPGYFLFLLVASIIPSLFCSRVAFLFVNWRAVAIAWLFVLAISQFWEATLGVPYGWWGYVPDQMMGIFFKAECDLPIEAALVWTLGSWTTVIVYETILTAIVAGRSGWRLFGVVRAPEPVLESVQRKYSRSSMGRN